MNLRYYAAHIIDQVRTGQSLTDSLKESFAKVPDRRDQRFLQALTFGVCRFYFQLEAIIKLLLPKPLKKKDHDIHSLLLVGLYQLNAMRVPPHAAVRETVAACALFKKTWAKSLVNALLRQFLRDQERVLQQIQSSPEAAYAHPLWMIAKIRKAYPEDWQAILLANNTHPPLSLRVNQQRMAAADYLQKVEGELIPETTHGITLTTALDVALLPGFLEGELSVQDGAAQLAADLLELAPKQRVLDACAAPGGKTTHILEIEPTVDLIAIDSSAERLTEVQENLTRLHLTATTIAADVLAINEWWDGQRFDRILLDVPCSASGVIRRHPDIKLLRRETDIAKLTEVQLRLLEGVWPLLKAGGLLLYATCSIFQEENAAIVSAFLQKETTAHEDKIAASWGQSSLVGRQILPGWHNMDGFYFARLRKGEG